MSQTQGKGLSVWPVSEIFHWMPLLGPFNVQIWTLVISDIKIQLIIVALLWECLQ